MVGGVRAPAPCRETQPWSRQVSASPSAGILCPDVVVRRAEEAMTLGLVKSSGSKSEAVGGRCRGPGPCSVAEDVGMGGISYKSKENTS